MTPSATTRPPSGRGLRAAPLWDPGLAGQPVLLAVDRQEAERRLSDALARAGAAVTVEYSGHAAAVAALRRLSGGEPFAAVVFDLKRDWPRGLDAAAALKNAGYAGIAVALVDDPRGSLAGRWRQAGCDPVARPSAHKSLPNPPVFPAHLPGG